MSKSKENCINYDSLLSMIDAHKQSTHVRFNSLNKWLVHSHFGCCRLAEVVGITQTCQSFRYTGKLQKDEWRARLCLGRQLLGGPQVGSPLGGIRETSTCNTNTATCWNRVHANADATQPQLRIHFLPHLKMNFSTKLLLFLLPMIK